MKTEDAEKLIDDYTEAYITMGQVIIWGHPGEEINAARVVYKQSRQAIIDAMVRGR